MSANALLIWMSARVEGSWQQFRSAVEELHVLPDETAEQGEAADAADQYAMPIYQALRLNLQRLGHAEFFAGAGDAEWRVAPPILAITRHPFGWRGVVAGARSAPILDRLRSVGDSCTLEVLSAPACPDPIRLHAPDAGSLAAAAKQAGLLWQMDAPAAILQCLPGIDDPEVRRFRDLPLGADWRVDRFSARDLSWCASSRAQADSSSGLSRWTFGHQRLFFLRRKGRVWAIPGQVGKYLMLRRARRRVLRYDPGAAAIRVPAACRPPFLVERAIIACSGLPPDYDPQTANLVYHDVPAETARLAAGILRQELT